MTAKYRENWKTAKISAYTVSDINLCCFFFFFNYLLNNTLSHLLELLIMGCHNI